MPRTRRTPRKERKKVVKVQFMPRPEKKKGAKADPTCPYGFIDRIVQAHHHDLYDARIAVAWLLDVKGDKDGHLLLGRCRKASDLDREFREFDIVILLNAKAWKELDEKQKAALVDHELCHAAVQTDRNGDPVLDERDRKCYRIRKHDIEEFNAIVKRHGLYLSDLQEFVRQAIDSPLFQKGTKDKVAAANGESGEED